MSLRTRRLLRQLVNEVLDGFGTKSLGKNSGGGNNLRYDVPVKASTNVLDDEAAEEQEAKQDAKQAACCLILSEDGLVLAVSRRDNPLLMGMPGGKIDPGEDAETAAARELQEETGLTATRLYPVFVHQEDDGYITTTFACEVEGQINTAESGVIRWVHPSVLLNPSSTPFATYNAKLFKHLGIATT